MGGSLSIESDNPVFPTSPCNRGRDAPPQGDETIQPTKLGEETPGGWKEQALLIPCKVCGHDARAKLCTEHQQNLISRSCTERLGAPISHYKVASGLYGPRNDTDWSLEFTFYTHLRINTCLEWPPTSNLCPLRNARCSSPAGRNSLIP
ncbi:uncharacterized protein LOC116406982 isoform X1 [Xenopus tropicalis]|uniref:Uncharacterized protein LOC116406982 isoform X1 n=1 Tax=Xenopus tropicalis TaxID=8364 RepID=A0A8J1IRC5_XENTR|nr:uncharacterized protein LOC116406982 isoform X1 [Xenopus tropicalis]